MPRVRIELTTFRSLNTHGLDYETDALPTALPRHTSARGVEGVWLMWTEGGGVKNPIFLDVINGWPLSTLQADFAFCRSLFYFYVMCWRLFPGLLFGLLCGNLMILQTHQIGFFCIDSTTVVTKTSVKKCFKFSFKFFTEKMARVGRGLYLCIVYTCGHELKIAKKSAFYRSAVVDIRSMVDI